MAWYNINSQDSVTAETLEKIRTERCGFCGQEKPVCRDCYVQNSKKAIAT